MDPFPRGLAPYPLRATPRKAGTPLLFWAGVVAVAVQLTFSSQVLSTLGYTGKIHPATFLLTACAIYAIARGTIPLHHRLRETPALILFVFGIPAVMLYSIYFVGFQGSTVFVETFWSAGLLALLLEPASIRQKRLLGGILIALVAGNVLVGLYESVTHVELFPLSFGDDAPDAAAEVVDDFRAHAFFIHPLTASVVTSMAIFLLYQMRLRLMLAGPLFILMLLGLLAFGGRTALGVTTVVSLGAAAYVLISGILNRRLSLGFVLTLLTAVVIIPAVFALIASQTTIADRIIHNFYYDDSAAVRATQWDIFNHLTLKDWLFGIPKEQLNNLKYQIGLGDRDTDIENCWILLLLDLGAIGFACFVTLFGGFLVHLARHANTLNGWLLAGSVLVIDSTSNSLGVWTNDLLIEVAFMIAIAGFGERRRVTWMQQRVQVRLPMARRATGAPGGLMLIPGPMRETNLRAL